MDDPLPKGSVQKVLKHHTKAPRRERIVKLRLIEREVQASRVTAKGEYMIQNKHRAWIAPKARPQPKSSGSRVKKEFIEIQLQRGVTMVSLTGSEASDVGDMEEIPGALPESVPTPTKGPKSMSSGLTGHERITSETIVRIGTDPQGEVGGGETTGDKAWNRLFHEAEASRAGEGEIHVPGQVVVEAIQQRRVVGNGCLYFRIGGSRSSSPGTDRGELQNLRRFESTRRTPRQTPSLLPMKAKARPVGPQPPPGPPPGWQDPVVDRPEETTSPAVAKPKEPASPVSVDPDKMLAVIAQTEIPEPKTPPIPGPKTPHQRRDPKRKVDRSPKSKKRWRTRC